MEWPDVCSGSALFAKACLSNKRTTMALDRSPELKFDGHFVQQSETILAILVEGHPRIISVKLFLALAAVLFSGAKPF